LVPAISMRFAPHGSTAESLDGESITIGTCVSAAPASHPASRPGRDRLAASCFPRSSSATQSRLRYASPVLDRLLQTPRVTHKDRVPVKGQPEGPEKAAEHTVAFFKELVVDPIAFPATADKASVPQVGQMLRDVWLRQVQHVISQPQISPCSSRLTTRSRVPSARVLSWRSTLGFWVILIFSLCAVTK
jgi:hypothetical protein